MSDGYRLGIALGGGAARGFFHIGVLKALEEAGIVADCVSGTSVGSLVASIYAAAVPLDELVKLSAGVQWGQDVFDMRQTFLNIALSLKDYTTFKTQKSPPGLFESSKIADFINRLIENRTFSQIRPLVLSATDIQTGDKLEFCSPEIAARLAAARERPLSIRPELEWEQAYIQKHHVVPFENVGQAARASSCFPGVISSVPMDVPDLSGTVTRRLLNDGGICEQVPTKALRALGCRKVLGILIGYVPQYKTVENFVKVQLNSVQFVARSMIVESLKLCDYVVYDPRIEEKSMVRMDPALVTMGYDFTRERLPEIRRALELDPPAAESVG